ncbi:uncharacterized protein LY79DRAFT_326586 [Colletotrichum navitas]|uniref:Uncharacterized protein n=1 Tax=Colletotrichum navitas TaxID=681940 RepID=A0AAD8VAB5_9PEZI|nr:uncharacterized protein LY79DRAFT_326586 [Colletotrichum navitas]KAK1598038.1 hypothetical protein LY79DRAFT_326586 [Colletotrichum navitas]
MQDFNGLSALIAQSVIQFGPSTHNMEMSVVRWSWRPNSKQVEITAPSVWKHAHIVEVVELSAPSLYTTCRLNHFAGLVNALVMFVETEAGGKQIREGGSMAVELPNHQAPATTDYLSAPTGGGLLWQFMHAPPSTQSTPQSAVLGTEKTRDRHASPTSLNPSLDIFLQATPPLSKPALPNRHGRQ